MKHKIQLNQIKTSITEIHSHKLYYILISIGFILFFSTRLYNLSINPPGIHVDEAGMAYDAWSLVQFGVDRYLISFPVYFINFGGGQNALYTYLTAILFKLFGFSYALIRVPAFFNSLFIMVFGAKLVQRYFGKYSYYVPMFILLLGILPYFIMASRIGLESNLMLGTSTLMLYLLSKAIDTEKIKDYLIAGFFAGIILYSYAISYMILPIYFSVVFLILVLIGKTKFKQVLVFGIPLFLMSLPLLTMLFINAKGLPSISIGLVTIPKLLTFRSAEITTQYILQNMRNIIKVTLFNDWLVYNTLPKFLTLYWISIPFVVLGALEGIRHVLITIRNRSMNVFVLIWLHALSIAFVGLFIGGNGPNANKLNSIFFPLVFFILVAIDSIQNWMTKINHGKLLKSGFKAGLLLIYTFNFFSFITYYFKTYPNEMKYPYLFAPVYDEVLEFIEQDQNLSQRIVYFENSHYQGYIYYLLSSRTNPYDFDITNNNTGHYELHYFYHDESYLDENCVYVVNKEDTKYMNFIESSNLFDKLEFEEHYIYY